MGKEYLEAFGRIALHVEYDNDGSYDCLNFEDDCKLVDEALQRLEDIDNANPTEALKELNEIIEYITEDKKVKYKATILFDCEIIKDALIKAEKDKAKIEKLKHENAILKAEIDAFKKIAFKGKSE